MICNYNVSDKDAGEFRAIKKAQDALKNDPFFQDKKNKKPPYAFEIAMLKSGVFDPTLLEKIENQG